MTRTRLTPRVVLCWGIAVTVAAVALDLFYLPVSYTMQTLGATGVDAGLLSVVHAVLGVAKELVPRIGAALIAASIVMFHGERLARERPPTA
ncbi:hypothetical protein [Leifsonia poae]|uniref:Uncharacterized protein n=1 Tax=Leifsonia poae TaxID=110933 RepID=A0A9W6HB61_9MICO|nr:hypothetical protein [Leifsonia poae]GLJ76848.1 hypothetical protein GCM10017584_24220 [Leifsonia poae]